MHTNNLNYANLNYALIIGYTKIQFPFSWVLISK